MLSFKTPWKRSPQNHAKPVRLKEKGLRGCFLGWLRAGRHLWNHSQLEMPWCGQNKPHISLNGQVSARDVFIQQSKEAQSRGRYKPKKTVLERCGCSAQTFLPSEHKLTWGMIKQARSCLQIYFSFFLQTSHNRILICHEKLVLNRTSQCKR